MRTGRDDDCRKQAVKALLWGYLRRALNSERESAMQNTSILGKEANTRTNRCGNCYS